MTNLQSHSPTITKRIFTAVAATFAVAGVLLTSASLTKPASALECVRAPHTVTLYPQSVNQAPVAPGTTVWYHMEITNNDSPGCGKSEFTFDGANIPADWTVWPYQQTELVDAPESTAYSMSFTSGANTYNGGYSYNVEVSRAEEPTVVNVPIDYTVAGGQDMPAPDTYPSVYVVSPAANSTVTIDTPTTISVNASDDKGITNLEYLVNGVSICTGTATTCVWNVPNVASSYTIYVLATDTVGHVTTTSRYVTAVRPADTTAPTVSITSPSANTTVSKRSSVTIRATAADNVGVTKIEFYVNGTLLCSGTATSCTWNVPNTRATYTLTVKAYDAAGNVTSNSLNVQSR